MVGLGTGVFFPPLPLPPSRQAVDMTETIKYARAGVTGILLRSITRRRNDSRVCNRHVSARTARLVIAKTVIYRPREIVWWQWWEGRGVRRRKE